MSDKVTINTLGNRGDGIAETSKGRIFVPFTLPGENVTINGTGARRELMRVLTPSADRVAAICRYFETCGGCQMQHYRHEAYLAWKRSIVSDAFKMEGLAIEVSPIVNFAKCKRRKAVFSAVHRADGVDLGFTSMRSHDVINVENCPIVVDEISNNLENIKQIIRPILPAKGASSVHVLSSDSGLDILVETETQANEKSRQSAIRLALDKKIARLSLGDETLIEATRPTLKMGDNLVSPPPGVFVQALADAENAMVDLVGNHLKSCKNTADLFCGIGTFALRLAQHSTVFACESIQPALDALDEAWRGSGGRLKLIKHEKRDLSVRPVMAAEFKKIQGVVFDPPRAGAQAQARQLAASKVRKIAAVSCNPTTLARDLAILIKGGFKVTSVTPLDQFVYTPHVEVVALLEREILASDS